MPRRNYPTRESRRLALAGTAHAEPEVLMVLPGLHRTGTATAKYTARHKGDASYRIRKYDGAHAAWLCRIRSGNGLVDVAAKAFRTAQRSPCKP